MSNPTNEPPRCTVDGCERRAVLRGTRCCSHYRKGAGHVIRVYADKPAVLREAALAWALAESDEEEQRGWWRLEKAAARWAEWSLRARVLELEMALAALSRPTETSASDRK